MQPPRRAGKSSQAPLCRARVGPEVPAGRWGGGAAGAQFLPGPAPAQAGPGAACGARLGRPQSSTVRLGRRAAVAPPCRALLAPARASSESLCRAHALPSLPLLPPPCVPPGVPGTASDSSLPAAPVRFPRGGGGGRGCGGGGGSGSISAATALLRRERVSSLAALRSFPAALRPETPAPAPFSPKRAGPLPSSFPPALHRNPGAAALADSCPSDPDRQGVPQGRSAGEKARQTGPCGV